MVRWSNRHVADESGQTLVEYAIILMLVAVVTVGSLELFGDIVSGMISDAASGVAGA